MESPYLKTMYVVFSSAENDVFKNHVFISLNYTKVVSFSCKNSKINDVHIRKPNKTLLVLLESIESFFRLDYVFILFRFHQNLILFCKHFIVFSVHAIHKSLETFVNSWWISKNFHMCKRCINPAKTYYDQGV